MISREYLMSMLTWAGMIGGAVVAVLLLVPSGNRRRAVYSIEGSSQGFHFRFWRD